MGKEIKVGLAVLGVLATVFGVVLFKKLSPGSPASEATPSAANEAKSLFPQSHETAKPSLSAETTPPASRTLLKATADDRYADTPPAESSPEPRPSFMPATERTVDPNDRYGMSARRARFAVPESTEVAPSGAENPFRRRSAEAEPAAPPTEEPAAVVAPPAAVEEPAAPPVEPSSPAPLQPENPRPIEPNPLRSGADAGEQAPNVIPEARALRGQQQAVIYDPQVVEAADERYVANGEPVANQQNFAPPAAPQQSYQPAQVQQDYQAAAAPPQEYRPAAPLQEAQPFQRSVVVEQQPVDDVPLGQPRSVLSRRSAPPEGTPVAYTQPIGPASYNAQDGRYAVQPNDSYWTISQKVYGKGGYFKAIYEHNKTKFPQADKLQVGDVLSVPAPAILEQTYPDLCPKTRSKVAGVPGVGSIIQTSAQRAPAGSRMYVVEEGDTLFDIARYELGKASRWGEIYDLNRETLGEDFDYLQPGTQLVLPGGAAGAAPVDSQDSMTRNPAAPYRR